MFSTTLNPSTIISIHAPREGRDIIAFYFGTQSQKFQSTRPARGATPEQMP